MGVSRSAAAAAGLAALLLLCSPARAGNGLQVCDVHGLVRGAEIAMEKGCFGCHTLSQKRIGPPYKDVAAKYQKSPIPVTKLAEKIRTGGSGVWGSIPMPPNPVTAEEAEALARWIQSLQ